MKRRICFLLSALLISSLAVASVGVYLKYVLFKSIGLKTQESIVSLPFVLMVDKELSYSVSYLTKIRDSQPQQTSSTQDTLPTDTGTTQSTTEATEPQDTVPAEPVYFPVA